MDAFIIFGVDISSMGGLRGNPNLMVVKVHFSLLPIWSVAFPFAAHILLSNHCLFFHGFSVDEVRV